MKSTSCITTDLKKNLIQFGSRRCMCWNVLFRNRILLVNILQSEYVIFYIKQETSYCQLLVLPGVLVLWNYYINLH